MCIRDSFINAPNLNEHTIKWQVVIHIVFLLSALAMVWVDRVMSQTLTMSKVKHGAGH